MHCFHTKRPIWPNHETPGINEVGGMAVYFRKVPKIGLVTAIMFLSLEAVHCD